MTYSRKSADVKVEFEGFGVLPDVDVLSIDRSLGGARTDTAVIVINDTPRNKFAAQDCNLYDLLRVWDGDTKNTIVKISVADKTGNMVIVFRGAMVSANYELGPNGETVTCLARTDWHLLQDPYSEDAADELDFNGKMFADTYFPRADGDVMRGYHVRGKVTYNPYVDGILMPNCGLTAPVPEECIPRNKTVAEIEAKLSYWTLLDIVHHIFRVYNLENNAAVRFADVDFDSSFEVLDGAPSVKNLELDFTQPITVTLDKALDPYGYSWYLDHNHAKGTVFAFVDRRTADAPKVLTMPKYGELVHSGPDRTTAKSISIQYDVSSNAANQFYVIHGGTVLEGVWYLQPAWDPELDFTDPELLVESDDVVEVEPKYKRVFRDWVLNECGDYDEMFKNRLGIVAGAGVKQVEDAFEPINSKGICTKEEVQPPQRRKFLPMLSLDADGAPKGSSRGGVEVEYWTKTSGKWAPISELLGNDASISVLANECGIRFSSGERPPQELFDLRNEAIDAGDPSTMGRAWWMRFALRVTASIQGNDVVAASVSKSHGNGDSFLSEPKPYYIDNRNVRSAVVSSSSKYYGAAVPAVRPAEVDMRADAQEECDRAAEVYGMATCAGSIVLEGVEDGSYWLGKTIEKMILRDVSFVVSPPNLPPKYPMVVAAHYDMQRQEVTLTLDVDRVSRSLKRGRREAVGWKRQTEVMDLRR